MADYNILMRDFPIKDLLAADSPELICSAINTIFTHLRKIRSTNYPTERAVGLIEAISKDVNGQLLKALSVHKLIQITYNEFEKVRDWDFVFWYETNVTWYIVRFFVFFLLLGLICNKS